jgi:hypothetical protein
MMLMQPQQLVGATILTSFFYDTRTNERKLALTDLHSSTNEIRPNVEIRFAASQWLTSESAFGLDGL